MEYINQLEENKKHLEKWIKSISAQLKEKERQIELRVSEKDKMGKEIEELYMQNKQHLGEISSITKGK